MVRYRISDTGIGMSKEFQERIFESFTRTANAFEEDKQNALYNTEFWFTGGCSKKQQC